jgi:hypothetical protein
VRYRHFLKLSPLPSPHEQRPLITTLKGRGGLFDRHVRLLLQSVLDRALHRPNADTFIVNHGVADHDLLVDAVPEALSPRIKFIGEVTAERERLSPALKHNIEQALFPPAAPDVRFSESAGSVTVPQAEPSSTENTCDPKELACRITLDWDQSLYDMDLSIEAIDSSGVIRYVVSYRDKGSLIQKLFACLQEDVRSGPGKENVELSALHFPRYRIIVQNHSKLGEFSTSNISCRVTMNGVECSVLRPVPNGGYEWVVGFIDASGRLPLIETYPDITPTTSDLVIPGFGGFWAPWAIELYQSPTKKVACPPSR